MKTMVSEDPLDHRHWVESMDVRVETKDGSDIITGWHLGASFMSPCHPVKKSTGHSSIDIQRSLAPSWVKETYPRLVDQR